MALTRAASETARLRGKVIRVLEVETEEIRRYLDRPEPDVSAALRQLTYITNLIDDLKR